MGRESVHHGEKNKKKEYPGEGRKPQTSAKCAAVAYAVAAVLLAVTNQFPAHTPAHIRLSTLPDSLALDAEFLD